MVVERTRVVAFVFLVYLLLAGGPAVADGAISGADFSGGAAGQFGSSFYGERVNLVYARATGPLASMEGVVTLESVPEAALFLHLKGRDDDAASTCSIEVRLNGEVVFEGPNPCPGDRWETVRFPLRPGLVQAGANRVTVTNREAEGQAGLPPWFMVAWCAIGGEEIVRDPNNITQLLVSLPEEPTPFPTRLPAGKEPGFRIRGTKGWNWTPEQYLAEIPILARYKMNFLMNCYLSMFSHDPFENRWWEPIPQERRDAWKEVVERCRDHGVEFCFAIHPQFGSPRPMDPLSEDDFEALWQHFDWAQRIGVKWFSMPLDDVHIMEGVRISGAEHAAVVNKLFARLRDRDPEAEFIFCPTWYWGDGSGEKERTYLEALARDLHPDVYLFWTGDSVVGDITRKGAETYRSYAQHRIILWDNYPVNDGHQAMHLGPVLRRDPDLCDVVDGYMSNPHASQSEINRIPLLTCADYAWNPWDYDPLRSIGQAIVHLEERPEARLVLRDLVQAYPGMLAHRRGQTSFNSVRDQYERLAAEPHSAFAAAAYIAALDSLADRMQTVFPNRYGAARKTLEDDVQWLREAFAATYGTW